MALEGRTWLATLPLCAQHRAADAAGRPLECRRHGGRIAGHRAVLIADGTMHHRMPESGKRTASQCENTCNTRICAQAQVLGGAHS